ncbi:hypothetical protein SteCoe_19749 [Stentor coeruleus]|uniref:Major facilitator superfamily (MFS) profile domain-containing protein n=1 Tax=Stentor coeruleus TaxID=5963 RepID=A0A1R2BTT0_9CILI|nr:hypothetical protein SteCoe_19749 [Stentor coeruleus]
MIEFYLSQDNSIKVTEGLISEYSGYFEAVYRLSQVFACFFWSTISDSIGRVPVLIIGLSGQFICSIFMCTCTNYNRAFIIRLFSGLMSGNSPVIKSLISEVTLDSNISNLYSYFALGTGISYILGPALSSLSSPTKNYEFMSQISFFSNYPYFIPFFLQSLIFFIALMSTLIFLRNTRKGRGAEGIKCTCIKEYNYIIIVVVYSVFAFAHMGSRLVFSLFCKTGIDKGGLGLASEKILSLIQGLSGIIIILCPPILMPILKKKFGLIRSMTYLCIGSIISISLLMLAKGINLYYQICILAVSYGLFNSTSLMFFSYISIGLSNCVSQNVLGAAFGFSNIIVGNSRFGANAVIGIVFSWSIEDGIKFSLIDASFSIVIISVMFILTVLGIVCLLNSSIEKRKIEEDDKYSELINKKD